MKWDHFTSPKPSDRLSFSTEFIVLTRATEKKHGLSFLDSLLNMNTTRRIQFRWNRRPLGVFGVDLIPPLARLLFFWGVGGLWLGFLCRVVSLFAYTRRRSQRTQNGNQRRCRIFGRRPPPHSDGDSQKTPQHTMRKPLLHFASSSSTFPWKESWRNWRNWRRNDVCFSLFRVADPDLLESMHRSISVPQFTAGESSPSSPSSRTASN